jgi:hypothetical protein
VLVNGYCSLANFAILLIVNSRSPGGVFFSEIDISVPGICPVPGGNPVRISRCQKIAMAKVIFVTALKSDENSSCDFFFTPVNPFGV